jgi:hypothetical protein
MAPSKWFKVEGVDALVELALNLHWSWNHAADELWEALDGDLWTTTQNPWVILRTVAHEKIKAALGTPKFGQKLDGLLQQNRESYQADAWFQHKHPDAALTSVAYFSMEFMLSEALPIYSGDHHPCAAPHSPRGALRWIEERNRLPSGVRIIEGGTLRLDLHESLRGISHLLVLDAVDTGVVPGALFRFEGKEIDTLPVSKSVYLLGFSDLNAPHYEFRGCSNSCALHLPASKGLELESSQASDARILPVANAIDESEAP